MTTFGIDLQSFSHDGPDSSVESSSFLNVHETGLSVGSTYGSICTTPRASVRAEAYPATSSSQLTMLRYVESEPNVLSSLVVYVDDGLLVRRPTLSAISLALATAFVPAGIVKEPSGTMSDRTFSSE